MDFRNVDPDSVSHLCEETNQAGRLSKVPSSPSSSVLSSVRLNCNLITAVPRLHIPAKERELGVEGTFRLGVSSGEGDGSVVAAEGPMGGLVPPAVAEFSPSQQYSLHVLSQPLVQRTKVLPHRLVKGRRREGQELLEEAGLLGPTLRATTWQGWMCECSPQLLEAAGVRMEAGRRLKEGQK